MIGTALDRDRAILATIDHPVTGYYADYEALLQADFQLQPKACARNTHTLKDYSGLTVHAVYNEDATEWVFLGSCGRGEAPIMHSAEALITWMRVEGWLP